jgi:dienelactone hydrolase
MEHAKADYQFVAYPNAWHSFTNPEATENGKRFGIPLAYEAEADRRSWEDMKQFLARVLV